MMKIDIVDKKNYIKLIFIVFLLFQLVHHSFVWLYHDDYGYLSLHYGYSGGTEGMSYNLFDIFKYLQWHYLNWGGRVLFFFFFIVINKLGGITLLKIIQSLIITGIFYETYLIVRGKNKDSIILALSTILMWGTFSIWVLNDGVFWFTASVLYTWPIFFFLFGILLTENLICIKNSKIKVFLQIIVFFIAACSQEQIAILVITYCLISYLYKKKINFIILLSSILGGLIEIFAPGNFIRAQSSIVNKNYLMTLLINIGKVININFGFKQFYLVMIIALISIIGYKIMIDNGYKYKKISYLSLIINIIYIFILLLNKMLSIDIGLNKIIYIIIPFWVCNNFAFLISYLLYYKEHFLISIFIGGCFSQIFLIISPSISYRTMLVFQYIIHIILLSILARYIANNKNITKIFCSVYMIISVVLIYNTSVNLIGYIQNNEVNYRNNIILTDASKKIQDGEKVDEIIYINE